MKIKFFAFFMFLIPQILSDILDDYKCDVGDKDKNLKIGDTTTLCIHFKEIKVRMAFPIEVDKFSLFNIAGGYLLSDKYINKQIEINDNNETNVTLLAQIGDSITSFPANFYYYDDESGEKLFFPLLNIVIKVDKGKIYDIVWDNNCYSCKKEKCMSYSSINIKDNTQINTFKNCMNNADSCGNENEDSLNCDPKFYVTWFGTDKDNRQMKSSNMAMSKFKHYSIESLYDNLCEGFNDQKKEMTDKNFKDIDKTVDKIISNDIE
jgi:hypothetical protein